MNLPRASKRAFTQEKRVFSPFLVIMSKRASLRWPRHSPCLPRCSAPAGAFFQACAGKRENQVSGAKLGYVCSDGKGGTQTLGEVSKKLVLLRHSGEVLLMPAADTGLCETALVLCSPPPPSAWKQRPPKYFLHLFNWVFFLLRCLLWPVTANPSCTSTHKHRQS